jgi:hypothetical protein
MRIIVPSAPDLSAERASFLVHTNRLRAFGTLAGFSQFPLRDTKRVLEQLASRAAEFPVPGGPRGKIEETAACLNRAWGTELVMCGAAQYAADDEELLKLTNSWAAVQTYYCAYHVTQALIVAEGRARPTSHGATQGQYVDLWVARGARLDPWTFAVGSHEDKRCGQAGMANGPGRPLEKLNSLSACTTSNCWEHAEQALRTTREAAHKEKRRKAVDEKLRARQREWTERYGSNPKRRRPDGWSSRPRLDVSEKAKVEKGTRPFTLIDYLYRLRIKANYEDARVYTDGPSGGDEALALNKDLMRLATATGLVHEVRIAQLIGPERFLHHAEDWVERHAPLETVHGLPVRLPALRKVLSQ